MKPININLQTKDGKTPLYQQIVEQIRNQVLTGKLPAGEQLPSIRTLAKELQVSIITTKRAYDELEQEGIVHTLMGKGTFVSSHPPGTMEKLQRDEMKELIRISVQKAKEQGVAEEEFLSLSATIYKEEMEWNQ